MCYVSPPQVTTGVCCGLASCDVVRIPWCPHTCVCVVFFFFFVNHYLYLDMLAYDNRPHRPRISLGDYPTPEPVSAPVSTYMTRYPPEKEQAQLPNISQPSGNIAQVNERHKKPNPSRTTQVRKNHQMLSQFSSVPIIRCCTVDPPSHTETFFNGDALLQVDN